MKKVKLSALNRLDAEIAGVGVGRGRWKEGDVTRFVSEGRRSDLLFCQTAGERSYEAPGREPFILKTGEIILIPTGERYVSRAAGGKSEGIYIDFHMRDENGEPMTVAEAFTVVKDPGRFRARIEKMLIHPGERLRVKALLAGVLAEISAGEEARALTESEFGALYPAIRKLEENTEEPVSVAALAKLCCMSETGFREKFKRYSGGIPPLEYRNRLRVERAEEMIRTGNFTVTQAAEMLGFYDLPHYYRVLKRVRERKG